MPWKCVKEVKGEKISEEKSIPLYCGTCDEYFWIPKKGREIEKLRTVGWRVGYYCPLCGEWENVHREYG